VAARMAGRPERRARLACRPFGCGDPDPAAGEGVLRAALGKGKRANAIAQEGLERQPCREGSQ